MRLAVALVFYGALLVFCLGVWLFDNLVFEGICGRFGSFDGSDVCHIGSLGDRKVSDDAGVSFTVLRFLFTFVDLSTEQKNSLRDQVDMCRGSLVKDTAEMSFQLESLILAQNERWRQA